MKKETLFIETWYSECGNCGHNTDGNEKYCKTLLGYGFKNGTKGCGAKWKYVSSHYSEGVISNERLKEIRPDLIIDRSII